MSILKPSSPSSTNIPFPPPQAVTDGERKRERERERGCWWVNRVKEEGREEKTRKTERKKKGVEDS